jgi:crossover junction endodeoxyribonuclease RusA
MRWTEQNHAAWKRREAARGPVTLPLIGECNGGDRRIASKRVELIIPWPPTVNHSTIPAIGGGRILTPEHRAFRCLVQNIVTLQHIPRAEGRLRVVILLFPPDKRKWDIDNRVKAVCDALQHAGVIEDDAHIDQLEVRRMPCFQPGIGTANVAIQTLE